MEYVILVLLIMTVAVVSVAAYVYYHPQIIIGKIQDLLYKGKPINSYEPFGKPEKKIKENGQLYMLTLTDGYMTAWMLYQLYDDVEAAKVFVGDDAEITSNTKWQDIEKNQ